MAFILIINYYMANIVILSEFFLRLRESQLIRIENSKFLLFSR